MSNVQLVRNFIRRIQSRKSISSETVRAYQNDLRQFLRLVHFPLSRIDDLRAERYLARLNDLRADPRTVARKLSTLRSFYNYLLHEGVVKNNPFRYLHFAESTMARNFEYLLGPEVKKLRIAINNETTVLKWRDLVLLDLLHGLKLGVNECANLSMKDLDFGRQNLITVNVHQLVQIHRLNKGYRHDLKVYLIHCRSVIMQKFSVYHHRLLINYRGRPLTVHGIEYIFNRLAQRGHLTKSTTPRVLQHSKPRPINLMLEYRKYFSKKS